MTQLAARDRTRVRSFFFVGYRALWWIAFVSALVFVGFVHPRDEAASQAKYHAFMRVGFSVWWNPSTLGQKGGPFGDVGRRAGIQFGDILYAVDGRPLPTDTPGRIAAVSGPEGQVAILSLRRSDGSTYSARIPRSDHYEADAYRGSGITFAGRRWAVFVVDTLARIVSLAAALLLFLRRPRDLVAGVLSSALIATCFHSINISTTMPGAFGLAETFVNAVAVQIAILLFPRGRFTTPWHWLALVLVVTSAFNVTGVSSLVDMGANFALILAVVAQFRATPAGLERQQIKFVLFGVVLSMLLTFGGNIIDQISYGDIPEGQAAWLHLSKWTLYALAALALPAGLLVSLVRYRLYDADTAIARSIAYGALTVLILAAFSGSEKLIELLGEEYFGERLGAAAGGLAAALAAVLIVPLHHRVSHWVEHRVQKHLQKLRHGLPLLVGDLRETADLDQMAAVVLDRVREGVRADRAALVIGDAVTGARGVDEGEVREWLGAWKPSSTDRLECDRQDRLFPVRAPLRADGHGNVGWLLLGPRPDGTLYGRDERRALDEVADPIARAFQVVVTRLKRDGQINDLIHTLGARLAAAEQALAGLAKKAPASLKASRTQKAETRSTRAS